MENFFTQILNAQSLACFSRVNGNFHVYRRGVPNPYLYEQYGCNGYAFAIPQTQMKGMYKLYENGTLNRELLSNLASAKVAPSRDTAATTRKYSVQKTTETTGVKQKLQIAKAAATPRKRKYSPYTQLPSMQIAQQVQDTIRNRR